MVGVGGGWEWAGKETLPDLVAHQTHREGGNPGKTAGFWLGNSASLSELG